MFDWITKPFIQWNFIDKILSTIETIIISILIFIIGFYILELKDYIKEKYERKNKRKHNK